MTKFVDMEVGYVDHLGSDVNVVNAARVSYAKEVDQFDEGKDAKLLNYLAKHDHWSPFAHTSVSLRIKAPIFVARQLVKHYVGGNWNEESRRYISDEPEFHNPLVWRSKPEHSKQGSGDKQITSLLDGGIEGTRPYPLHRAFEEHVENSLFLYKEMLRAGVSPEQARMALPQNTMTNWIWTGSVMFFARVCQQRLASDTQQETREVAERIQEVVKGLYPHSWKALMQKED